jgi:hypothetical protein
MTANELEKNRKALAQFLIRELYYSKPRAYGVINQAINGQVKPNSRVERNLLYALSRVQSPETQNPE